MNFFLTDMYSYATFMNLEYKVKKRKKEKK